MSEFTCPVCGQRLDKHGSQMKCPLGHSYDISRRGYINLLMSQASSKKRHGDDGEMVSARTRFLSLGYYDRLRSEVCDIAVRLIPQGGVIADIGCGECYYTEHIAKTMKEKNIPCDIYGIDISKKALDAAGKRNCGISLAVASAFSLPIADEAANLMLNLFAPHEPKEFVRISAPGAKMIRVFPLERHLWELKEAVYDVPYENVIDTLDFPGFTLMYKKELSYRIHLASQSEILDLFTMTPYCYKTSEKDRKKLDSLTSLDTRVEFCIVVYEKSEI